MGIPSNQQEKANTHIRTFICKDQYHFNDSPAYNAYTASTAFGFGGYVQQAYSTSTIQTATMSTMMRLLIFSCTKSSSSMPSRCTALATQKNKPLITTEGMPDYYISRKASEVNEQKPICTSTISTMTKVRLDRRTMWREAIRRTAAASPMMLMMLMMLILEAPNLFLIRVPRLLETATVTFPTRPSKAICFQVQPCPSNITPKMPQQVQLVPTMLPQQIRVMKVSLWSLEQVMMLCRKVRFSCSYSSSSQIWCLRTIIRITVRVHETTAIKAMMPSRVWMRWQTSYSVMVELPYWAMQTKSQRMLRLIPTNGRKSGIDDAQPLCHSGNNFNNPQGALITEI